MTTTHRGTEAPSSEIEFSEKNDSRSLGALVCRHHRGRRYWLVVAAFAVGASPAHAQLLDRVVARVGGTAITQTDVDAAVGLGVIEADGAGGASAVQQMIDRRILLAEVARFPPRIPRTPRLPSCRRR
jgi:hypothetical protein